ncbi:MAG TPA: autotransporter-associated beta strand repeat-containing protein [Tepidisphaeraceae bacterium]|nr:autotransporter-associated beta strand repeat-containing protein [Tepidisphaeraceae bacterium]
MSKAYGQVVTTWSGNDTASNQLWSDPLNWAGAIPGATAGTNNQDTAVFNNTPASNIVTVDPNRNILNITFDTGNATNFTIGATANAGNPLLLSNGGKILETAAVNSAAAQTINAPLILEGTSYAIEADADGPDETGLVINGNISGGNSGPTTLTLQGANELSSSLTNSQIVGSISNGASSSLNLVVSGVSGSSVWELASTTQSTYTGTTTINSGTLMIGTADALPSTTDVIIAGTGTFMNNVATGPFPVVHTVTDDSSTGAPGTTTAGFIAANGNDVLNIDNNTGPALILNAQGYTSEMKYDSVFDLIGTGPSGTGGILFTNSTGMTTLTEDEKSFSLGTVNRDIYVTRGSSTNSTDIQLQNLTGSGGIILNGAGTVKFENAGEDTPEGFTGSIEIQEGQLKLIGSNLPNSLVGTNVLLVDGGQLNLNGAIATFGAATFTSGSTVLSSGALSTDIIAPSYTFNVAGGASFTMNNTMTDDTSPSAVVSNGAGTAIMAVVNTYSGGTTINAGTFEATDGNLGTSTASPVYTGTPFGTGSITMNGGNLLLSPNVNNGGVASAIIDQIATNSGTQFTYDGGATLTLKIGGQTSVELSIGGNGIVRGADRGTLVIAPTSSNANLGVTDLVIPTVAPTVINGIVNPSIVTENSDTNESGDFVAWGGATTGLVTYAGYTNTITAGPTAIFQATATSGNTLSANASLYALSTGNTTTGGQAINLGGFTLTVGDNTSGNQAGVIMNGGSITSGTLAFAADEATIYTSAANALISANITGAGGVTTFGPGTLALTGTNSFSDGLTINQGVLDVSRDANLGSATGNGITFGGGTLQFGAAFNPSSSRAITLDAGGGTIDTQANSVTIASAIGGVGGLSKVGSGTLTLTGGNTSQGSTTIGAGTLQIGTGGGLGAGGVTNNGALAFNSTGGSISVAGNISGTGTISQSGSGSTVSLSGSNTYTGATTINAGTLQVGNSNALGFGGVVTTTVAGATVNGGGTLDLNGQTLTKTVTLNGGTLTSSSGIGSFSTGVAGYVLNSGGAGISADLTSVTGGGGTGAAFKFLLGLTDASFTIASGNGGVGYTSAPTVTLSGGGGTGATAVATISGGAVTGITVTNPGIGYWGTPSVSLSGGGDSTAATVTANQDDFTVVATEALLAGSGYTSAPTAAAYSILNPDALATVVAPSITAVLDPLYIQSSSTITDNTGGSVVVPIPVIGTATTGTATLDLEGSSTNDAISGSISDGSGGGKVAILESGTGTWTLSNVNTYTGGTTVNTGTLVASVSGALPNGEGLVNNGTTDIEGNETLGANGVSALSGAGALNIGTPTTPATVQLAVGSGGATQGSLTIFAGSVLNIGNNHIVLSDPSGSIDSTIRAYLSAGYNNGNWNGTSATGGAINTSSPTGTKYGIGYADGADGGISGITSGQLEVKYTLYGDANLDGSVNSIDFGDMAANFGKSGKVWDQGDFNYDGTVNSIDFGLLAGNFGKSVGSNADVITTSDWAALDAFAAANGLMADVPEPATTSLVAVGLIGVLARRRRRARA